MIDTKIKEYEDQQHRIGNIIVYNLPEINARYYQGIMTSFSFGMSSYFTNAFVT